MSKDKISEVSSLRWLANMFPWTDDPKDETDRMTNCIHLYCTAGANKIEELETEISDLKQGITKEKNSK